MSRRARTATVALIHVSTETLIDLVRALDDNDISYHHCALVAEIESRAATDIVALIWSQTEGSELSEWTVSA